MINKAVVAAAGRGTRMLHLSKDKPKHLIEVNGRPFLEYVLDNLISAGYNEITVVGGYFGNLIEDLIKKYKPQSGCKIKFVDQFKAINPDEKYGTACPLMCDEIKDIIGSSQFLFVSGDNLYAVDDLKSMNIDDDYNYVAGLCSETPEKYGVLVVKNDFLEKIVEKPKEHIGNLVNAGMYKFTSEIFEKISQIEKSPRGEYEITDAISLLAKENKVKVVKIQKYWKDFGNPNDIVECSKFLKENGNNNCP